jgi:hypothetical protein
VSSAIAITAEITKLIAAETVPSKRKAIREFLGST